MEQFESNSKASKAKEAKKEEKKKDLKKVTKGRVIKKSNAYKFASTLIGDDIDNFKSRFVQDTILPTLKRSVYDMGINVLNTLFDIGEHVLNGTLYDGKAPRNRRVPGSRVTYSDFYRRTDYQKDIDRRHDKERHSYSGYDYNEFIVDTRGEAEETLDTMSEIIERYDAISVADVCEILDIESKYTDCKYGWYDIGTAKVLRSKEGYILKLPRPRPLDK